MVVVSCVAGVTLFFVVVVVVEVVVGVGFSTTVVHEFKSMATAKSGITMISFFIVIGVVPSQNHSAQMPQPDAFRADFFCDLLGQSSIRERSRLVRERCRFDSRMRSFKARGRGEERRRAFSRRAFSEAIR